MGIVFSAGTFGLNFQMTTALMATKVYDKGAGEYGMLGSIVAVGSLAGALIAARRTEVRQRLIVGAGIVFGATTAVAGLMPSYLTFALILPLCGLSALTLITAANAFVQMAVEPSMRGRVMALYMAVFMGGTPFGAPLLGWIADHAGARWTMIGGGILTVVGTVLAVLIGARRQGLVITRYVRSAIQRDPIGPVVTD
jgi:MFS family permease